MHAWHTKGEYIVDSNGRVLEADTDCIKYDDFNCFWKFSGKAISPNKATRLAENMLSRKKWNTLLKTP